ncbi:hypothetical protein A2U01_0096402, partial [Trifolium medium]|nr:hypothetical protein [Trifolium medium]
TTPPPVDRLLLTRRFGWPSTFSDHQVRSVDFALVGGSLQP